MKIFLVSNLYPSLSYPNFGTFVKEFESCMIKQGASIPCKVVIDKIYSNKIRRLFSYLYFYIKIVFVGLCADYDIIYVHYIAHPSPAIYLLSLMRRKKIVLNVHGDDILPRTFLVYILQYFIRLLLHHTSLVIVPSNYFKEIFLQQFPLQEDKIQVYPSGGVDRELFVKIDDARNITSFFDSDFVLGFVSRITSGKGWRLFVDSIKLLDQQNIRIKGLMIGDGEETKILEEMLQNENLYNLIHFEKKITHNNLSLFYSSMDLFIFPSLLNESLGLVGLEAMSCGIPVVGSNLAGIKTYVENGYNGYLFTPNNISDLINKIKQFYQLSQIDKNKMSQNCIKTVSQYDSIKTSKELYLKLMSL